MHHFNRLHTAYKKREFTLVDTYKLKEIFIGAHQLYSFRILFTCMNPSTLLSFFLVNSIPPILRLLLPFTGGS